MVKEESTVVNKLFSIIVQRLEGRADTCASAWRDFSRCCQRALGFFLVYIWIINVQKVKLEGLFNPTTHMQS